MQGELVGYSYFLPCRLFLCEARGCAACLRPCPVLGRVPKRLPIGRMQLYGSGDKHDCRLSACSSTAAYVSAGFWWYCFVFYLDRSCVVFLNSSTESALTLLWRRKPPIRWRLFIFRSAVFALLEFISSKVATLAATSFHCSQVITIQYVP